MQLRPFDRLPVIEWAGWWDETLRRSYREGLPLYITDRYEICDFFGLDLYKQQWFSACAPDCPQPESPGAGIIRDASDYRRLKQHLYPHDSVDKECWAQWAEEQTGGEVVLWFTVDGFFWFGRWLLGIERHMYSFYDQPDLLHRISADLADWVFGVIDTVCGICTPDFMTFAEDMSYNHGPMISRELFDEFMRPYYERILPYLRGCGVIPFVDSDGDITELAGWFEETGLEGLMPLERQAGADIAALRAEHPDLKYLGHFDKMVLNRGEEAIRAEFERLLPVAAGGGFLPSCDHQTPPGVSYRDYQCYLRLFREYASRAGEMSRRANRCSCRFH